MNTMRSRWPPARPPTVSTLGLVVVPDVDRLPVTVPAATATATATAGTAAAAESGDAVVTPRRVGVAARRHRLAGSVSTNRHGR